MTFEEPLITELITELKEMNRNIRVIEERLDNLNDVLRDCYTELKKL